MRILMAIGGLSSFAGIGERRVQLRLVARFACAKHLENWRKN